jgi:hypothetical protein
MRDPLLICAAGADAGGVHDDTDLLSGTGSGGQSKAGAWLQQSKVWSAQAMLAPSAVRIGKSARFKCGRTQRAFSTPEKALFSYCHCERSEAISRSQRRLLPRQPRQVREAQWRTDAPSPSARPSGANGGQTDGEIFDNDRIYVILSASSALFATAPRVCCGAAVKSPTSGSPSRPPPGPAAGESPSYSPPAGRSSRHRAGR